MFSNPQLETKFQTFFTGDTTTRGNEIEGYASLFGLADQSGDIVREGAYRGALERLHSEGRSIKFLWQHDPNQPIGVWDVVREDAYGLYVKGHLLESTSRGADALALVQGGAIDGLSIGYRTDQAVKRKDGGRDLIKIALFLAHRPVLSAPLAA